MQKGHQNLVLTESKVLWSLYGDDDVVHRNLPYALSNTSLLACFCFSFFLLLLLFKKKKLKGKMPANREVLQTEFRFDFRKGPRQISAGPGWSTPEEVELNFSFCKPNFLFRFDRSRKEFCSVGHSPHRDVQEDCREVESLLLLDHYLTHRDRQQRVSLLKIVSAGLEANGT